MRVGDRLEALLHRIVVNADKKPILGGLSSAFAKGADVSIGIDEMGADACVVQIFLDSQGKLLAVLDFGNAGCTDDTRLEPRVAHIEGNVGGLSESETQHPHQVQIPPHVKYVSTSKEWLSTVRVRIHSSTRPSRTSSTGTATPASSRHA